METPASFRALYGRVFANPKAVWLYPAVFVEGTLFFGFFPFAGEALLAIGPAPASEIARQVGVMLGAFSIGGLVYAFTVRRLLRVLGGRAHVRGGIACSARQPTAHWRWLSRCRRRDRASRRARQSAPSRGRRPRPAPSARVGSGDSRYDVARDGIRHHRATSMCRTQ